LGEIGAIDERIPPRLLDPAHFRDLKPHLEPTVLDFGAVPSFPANHELSLIHI
jgi:hypothetical protein